MIIVDSKIKKLISDNKLSDEQIYKALKELKPAESSDADEEQNDAEEDGAGSTPSGNKLTMEDLKKMIEESVKTAMKPKRKKQPLPKEDDKDGVIYIDGFGSIS